MKLRNLRLTEIMLSAALALATTANAQDPVITMQLGDYTTYADAVDLSTMTIPGSPTEDGYVGIYSFNVTASGTANVPQGTFWTACLSPAGEIDGGSPAATYNYESFAEANNGINPSAWAWNNDSSDPQYWGIQNASYLWEQVVGNNNQPTQLSKDQATGLALALWAALYNSSGYGVLSNTRFDPNFSSGNVGAAVQTAYDSDLALLNPTAVAGHLGTGYVLVPTSETQNGYPYGQEFIFMVPENASAVVPESTGIGICAGLGALIFSLRGCLRRSA